MILSPAQAFGLTAVLGLGVMAFGSLPVVRSTPAFQWSFVAPGLGLLLWSGWLFGRASQTGRMLGLAVELRAQHYVQALAQAAVLLYWGLYWQPVYVAAFLIAAQLVFAYGFDLLLSWSRRDTTTLGFGPFPVVFSINLFLWFGDEWFLFQFGLIALGFAAKELLRWTRDGRRVHIFNPSSFPLAVCSLVLILTGTSDITWGQDIAISQFYPPHIYLVLFLVALPGQYLFGVASMTLSAVVATYAFSLVYVAVTGVYFFYDSHIPIAVFLGMHLLITDPSTAPRTELGRIAFGVLYGLSTVALYAVLGHAGVPTFYDKLLQVPLLNLSVRVLDGVVRSGRLRALDPATRGRSLGSRQRHARYMAVWAGVFALMSVAQGVGDRHPGQWIPFWQEACDAGRPAACRYLAGMQLRFCQSGSGWACNEAALLQITGAAEAGCLGPDCVRTPLADGCDLGFATACRNLTTLLSGRGTLKRAPPTLADYPIILRGTKGPIADRSPAALYTRACDQGWTEACDQLRR